MFVFVYVFGSVLLLCNKTEPSFLPKIKTILNPLSQLLPLHKEIANNKNIYFKTNIKTCFKKHVKIYLIEHSKKFFSSLQLNILG